MNRPAEPRSKVGTLSRRGNGDQSEAHEGRLGSTVRTAAFSITEVSLENLVWSLLCPGQTRCVGPNTPVCGGLRQVNSCRNRGAGERRQPFQSYLACWTSFLVMNLLISTESPSCMSIILEAIEIAAILKYKKKEEALHCYKNLPILGTQSFLQRSSTTR